VITVERQHRDRVERIEEEVRLELRLQHAQPRLRQARVQL